MPSKSVSAEALRVLQGQLAGVRNVGASLNCSLRRVLTFVVTAIQAGFAIRFMIFSVFWQASVRQVHLVGHVHVDSIEDSCDFVPSYILICNLPGAMLVQHSRPILIFYQNRFTAVQTNSGGRMMTVKRLIVG